MHKKLEARGLDKHELEVKANLYGLFGSTYESVNEAYLQDCQTKYQYTRKLYQLFKQEYKGKARQKYTECYNLLKLRTE